MKNVPIKAIVVSLSATLAVSLIGQIPATFVTRGLVTKRDTATKIATMILEDNYGKENIARQLPLQLTEQPTFWVVSGTLGKGLRGGVARIRIAKSDGRVLEIGHGK